MEGGGYWGIEVADMTGRIGRLIGGTGMMVTEEKLEGGKTPPLAHDAGGKAPPLVSDTHTTAVRTRHLQVLLVVPCGRRGTRRQETVVMPGEGRRLVPRAAEAVQRKTRGAAGRGQGTRQDRAAALMPHLPGLVLALLRLRLTTTDDGPCCKGPTAVSLRAGERRASTPLPCCSRNMLGGFKVGIALWRQVGA